MYLTLSFLFQVYEILEEANIPCSQVQELEACFKQYEYPFLNLETQYQQLKYYKNNFNLIVSNILSMLLRL